MQPLRFFLVGILLCTIETVLVKGETRYSLTYDESTNQWTLAQGMQQGWIAWAVYNKSTPLTGWDVLDVVTNANAKDNLQAYAAGYIEGALTQEALWNAWYTFYNGTLSFSIPTDLSDWLETNDKWVQTMTTAQSYSSSDEADYWAQVALTMQQFDGMVDGYNTFAPTVQKLSRMEFLVFQANDDISDISAALGKSYGRPANIKETHCSALVKLTEDGMNLFTSHVTWYSFMSMLRIYKHYDTPFHLNTTKSPKVSFSSIGGNLESGDDWYITSTNLVIMETSNNIFNMSLYQYVTPQTVLYWIRNLVANRMASSGQEWVKWFSMHNSGTYNNQWIIVDNKLFTPGQPLQSNTLWIAEQIPGWVISADQTELLAKTGYWASYNIPFFSFVYNISGYPHMKAIDGNSWSYTLCPRAQIFARDHHKVTDLRSMKRLMRYNEWQTDPLSLGDACNAISCRDDLNPPENSPTPFGGLDCKVTDQEMSTQLESHAVSGPTWDSQPVFAWTEEWADYPSYGQPRVFDFEFVDMKPVSKI